MRLIVVGGGIAGLSAAYFAKVAGHEVVCLDAGERPGGLIRSERVDGFLCESGPQALLDDAPDTVALLRALELDTRALPALPASKRRFLYVRGALRPVPASPLGLVRSGLLSWPGKLRLLAEPIVRRRSDGATSSPPLLEPSGARLGALHDGGPLPAEESLLTFATRRLGREAASRLFATAAIGIYAAEADRLGASAAFPRLVAMEHEHGSLLRGLVASRRAGRKPGHPISFPGGLEEVPAALARALGSTLIRTRASQIEPRAGGGWRVVASPSQTFDADTLVVATDLQATIDLLAPVVPAVASQLRAVEMVPLAVACLGFRDATAESLGVDLAAYGFLVARGETPKLLGCQYESSTFAGRAPPNAVLLRAILGGLGSGFDPEVVQGSESAVADRAMQDLRAITGLRRDPDLVHVTRYPRGLPLVDRVHVARVRAIDHELSAHRGLHLLGQAVRGVGINEGIRAAATLVRAL